MMTSLGSRGKGREGLMEPTVCLRRWGATLWIILIDAIEIATTELIVLVFTSFVRNTLWPNNPQKNDLQEQDFPPLV
jgi:hypothetical protein